MSAEFGNNVTIAIDVEIEVNAVHKIKHAIPHAKPEHSENHHYCYFPKLLKSDTYYKHIPTSKQRSHLFSQQEEDGFVKQASLASVAFPSSTQYIHVFRGWALSPTGLGKRFWTKKALSQQKTTKQTRCVYRCQTPLFQTEKQIYREFLTSNTLYSWWEFSRNTRSLLPQQRTA